MMLSCKKSTQPLNYLLRPSYCKNYCDIVQTFCLNTEFLIFIIIVTIFFSTLLCIVFSKFFVILFNLKKIKNIKLNTKIKKFNYNSLIFKLIIISYIFQLKNVKKPQYFLFFFFYVKFLPSFIFRLYRNFIFCFKKLTTFFFENYSNDKTTQTYYFTNEICKPIELDPDENSFFLFNESEHTAPKIRFFIRDRETWNRLNGFD